MAAEKHDLDYFRNQLLNFETEKAERAAAMAADAEAKAAAKEEAKAAKKLIIKPKPRKSLSEALGGEEDVEMADITMDPESDGDENEMIVAEKPKKTTKKRKTLEGEDASVGFLPSHKFAPLLTMRNRHLNAPTLSRNQRPL